nr:unnamed protein product [Digitaria exilis]
MELVMTDGEDCGVVRLVMPRTDVVTPGCDNLAAVEAGLKKSREPVRKPRSPRFGAV